MALVPFPRYMPDRSRFNGQASSVILNVKPTADGWGPLRALVGISDALPTAPRGGIAVKADNGTFRIFTGTATNLYQINTTDYTWDEISSTTDAYSLADGVFWRHTIYGNNLIATAVGSGTPQYVELNAGTQFAALTNATFEAEIVATVGDFLVFACVDGDKRKLRWSGVNDMTFWTNAQRGADTQVLPDGGAIQAIIPQAQNALIIQETCIRLMEFDPSSGVVFRFVMVDPERGAFAPRSVVNIGAGDFAYFAKDGFYRGIDAKPIGAERVDKFILSACDPAKYELISGSADPFEKIVWWRYEDTNGTSALLGYDWQLNEWFPSNNAALDLFPAGTAGITLDQATTLYGTLAGMPYALGSRFYQGGIPSFAGITSDFKFGFFDGDTLEATIETEDKALNYPRRAVTNQITILADTSDATVAIASKEVQGGTLSFGSALSRETGQPFINSRISGRWHRFQTKIPAGTSWKNASGIDVAFTDGGAR